MRDILVTGGAGKLGAVVVAKLAAQGQRARILTHSGAASPVAGAEVVVGDLATGSGLAAALADIRVVIHAASNSQQPQAADVDGTRHLLAAAQAGGLQPHIIYVSIVGVDRSTAPYYMAKAAAETLTRQSGLPWSILRATQFHGFVANLLRSLGIDTQAEVAVPEGVRFQSIDMGEVAARLLALAQGEPLRAIEEIGGPQILTVEEMASAYLSARGRVASVLPTPIHGAPWDGFRNDAILTPEHAIGVVSWEQYLHRPTAN